MDAFQVGQDVLQWLAVTGAAPGDLPATHTSDPPEKAAGMAAASGRNCLRLLSITTILPEGASESMLKVTATHADRSSGRCWLPAWRSS